MAFPHAGGESVKSAYHCATLIGNWEEDRRQFGQQISTTKGADQVESDTTYKASFKHLTPAQVAAAKSAPCFAAEAPRILLVHHGDIGNVENYDYATSELAFTDRRTQIFTNDEVLDMAGTSTRRSKTAALQRSTRCLNTTRKSAGHGGTAVDELGGDDVTAAVQREAELLQTLASTVRSSPDSASASQTSTKGDWWSEGDKADQAGRSGGNGGYEPPRLLPMGRVAERERLLTTKNVSLDATGSYLFDNLESYPLTSSKCVGKFMKSCDNPMHKTNLRVHYMEDDD